MCKKNIYSDRSTVHNSYRFFDFLASIAMENSVSARSH